MSRIGITTHFLGIFTVCKGSFTQNPVKPAYGQRQSSHMQQEHHNRQPRLSGVKRNLWLGKFLTSRHVRMHRVIFNISNTLRKLII